MREPPGGSSGDAPAFETVARLRCRLGQYLSGAVGRTVSVERVTKFPAGFSWITCEVSLSGFPGANEAILRVGPPYGLFAPYSAMPEFESLSALAASEVPAPRVYLASDDPAILGAPFFLSEKVEGDTPLPWGSQGQTIHGARRESLAADFISALAALHRFDWRATPLAKWGEGVTPENAALKQVDDWEARFRRWALRPHPMAHRALQWLRGNAPVAERLSLVHGDYRLGNFLERDGRISAILDWELVHLGDPVEDLGWAFLPQYRGRHAARLRARQRNRFSLPLRGAVRAPGRSCFAPVLSRLFPPEARLHPYGGGALLRGWAVPRPAHARDGDADFAGLSPNRPGA